MNRIQNLENQINKARLDYYNGQAQISDALYDALVEELKSLDPKNKAVTAIGAKPSGDWPKEKHQFLMGSLDKVNSQKDLEKWFDKYCVKNDKLIVVDKLDGLSISIKYDRGNFFKAITRGSGEEGELIGPNVEKMTGVPKKLKESFSGTLRGEILLTKEAHKKYFSEYSNPRNAASGISRRSDGKGCEHLTVYLYQIMEDAHYDDSFGRISLNSEEAQFELLKKLGFKTPNYFVVTGVDGAMKVFDEYQKSKRNSLEYDVDGLVIRINDLKKQLPLGHKDGRPRGAIAFKFANETRQSEILKIEYQTGNSGRLTPVATFKEVEIGGAKISRASLYNQTYINELKLDVGTKVLISRNNDVIPCVCELVQGTGTICQPPKNCPECFSSVKTDGEYLLCSNYNCKSQVIGRIENYIKELDILEWGTELIQKLVDSKLVSCVADLYSLSVKDLQSLERMGEKSAQKCYDLLHAKIEIPLETFLGSLSISLLRPSTVKLLMQTGYDTLDKITDLTKDSNAISKLESIHGLGEIKARTILDGLKNNLNLINKLIDAGIKIKKPIDGKLKGISFCFTGALSTKRNILEQKVTDLGGTVKSSASKGLTYLVAKDSNNGSNKLENAKKLGIKILSENEFLQMTK